MRARPLPVKSSPRTDQPGPQRWPTRTSRLFAWRRRVARLPV